MEKENNTGLSCGDPIEIGEIYYDMAKPNGDYDGNYGGKLFIRQTFGIFNILLNCTGRLCIVIPKKSVKWGKTYNAYVEGCNGREYFFNLPDYLIDLIGVRK